MENGEAERVEPADQLELVIHAFHQIAADFESRAVINKLQQKQLDDKEEASELEQLLQQAKQRQGL